jgi:hypothetical protein
MPLANDERPTPSRSRIHRARHLVGECRRLRKKVELAHALAKTDEERHWCLSAADKLDALILAGDAVLGGFADPREAGRVKKTDREWF